MDYTVTYTAGQDNETLFSTQLHRLTSTLGLPPPVFRGKQLSSPPGLERWEIETTLRGSTVSPVTPDTVYKELYPEWQTGLEQAIHGAMSRLCFTHRKALPRETFRQYGRRTMDGTPVYYEEGREKMTAHALHLMDLECSSVYVMDLLREEMLKNDQAQATIRDMKITNNEQLDGLIIFESEIMKAGARIEELQKENAALKEELMKKPKL